MDLRTILAQSRDQRDALDDASSNLGSAWSREAAATRAARRIRW